CRCCCSGRWRDICARCRSRSTTRTRRGLIVGRAAVAFDLATTALRGEPPFFCCLRRLRRPAWRRRWCDRGSKRVGEPGEGCLPVAQLRPVLAGRDGENAVD